MFVKEATAILMYVSMGSLQMILLTQGEHLGSDLPYLNIKEIMYNLQKGLRTQNHVFKEKKKKENWR